MLELFHKHALYMHLGREEKSDMTRDLLFYNEMPFY